MGRDLRDDLGENTVLNRKKYTKKGPMGLVLYLYIVLILLALFTAATYTWFTLSTNPWVSDMSIYVNAPIGLELAIDPTADEWTQQLDISKLLQNNPVLRPVTWVQEDQRFYAANYGRDGRLTENWQPLSDAQNASTDNYDGYYIAATIYARCGQKMDVSLSPAVDVAEGVKGSGTFVIGKPVWDAEQILHQNGGNGSELAIRIGFLVQKTDLNGVDKEEPAEFFIYEPNCDTHISGSMGYVSTPSIRGGDSLISEDRLIQQTTSMWKESDPVEKNVVIRSSGDFITDTTLFTLEPTEYARITVYIWLEGQDVDCTNEIGHEAKLLVSIQFAGDASGQSGMVPIE